ncbi:hypothetical protein ACFLTA_09310, partial [Bacteroidota bacterium]
MNRLQIKILAPGLLSLLLVLLTGSISKLQAQDTIWHENFDTLADGAKFDDGFTAWSIDTSNCAFDSSGFFRVEGERFEGRNTNGEGVWYSEQIKILGYTDVRISIDLDAGGILERLFYDENDYIRAYYSLDGGPEIILANSLTGLFLWVDDAAMGGLNGDTLQIIVKIQNNDTIMFPGWLDWLFNGTHVFDEIVVYEPPVPDPRYSIVGPAGGDWDNTLNWALSSDGLPCNCVPDEFSDVHISESGTDRLVFLDADADARNITIYDGGTLQWDDADVELRMNYQGTILVEEFGILDENAQANAQIKLVSNSSNYFIQNDGTFDIDDIILENENGGLKLSGESDINILNDLNFDSWSSSVVNNGTTNIAQNITTEDAWINNDNTVYNNVGGVLNIGNQVD